MLDGAGHDGAGVQRPGILGEGRCRREQAGQDRYDEGTKDLHLGDQGLQEAQDSVPAMGWPPLRGHSGASKVRRTGRLPRELVGRRPAQAGRLTSVCKASRPGLNGGELRVTRDA